MIVDDNPDDFLLLRHFLGSIAHTVQARRVETPDEMIAALDGLSWDVVLVDWVLPQFDAPAALAILRQRENAPPCIVVSGHSDEMYAVLAVKLGAKDYINKNKARELLPAVIERELVFSSSTMPFI